MMLLSVLICVSMLLQASLSTFCSTSKPEPVDLEYSCLKVISHHVQNDDAGPVILLHGMSSFKESWKGINEVVALETGRRVCVVDLRNHGESPWSNETDTAIMTEDIKHLLDKLNVPKAVVLGHSLGGKIAVHLSLNYPERVEKAIIEDMRPNTISPGLLHDLHVISKMLKDVDDIIPQGVSEKEAKVIFLKNLNDHLAKSNSLLKYDDPDMFPIKCKDGKCRYGMNPLIYKMVDEDVNSFLIESTGRFDGPALFIYGTESNFDVPGDEINIKELFPNAKLVGVEGAGHIVHLLPKFTSEVIKFINEK